MGDEQYLLFRFRRIQTGINLFLTFFFIVSLPKIVNNRYLSLLYLFDSIMIPFPCVRVPKSSRLEFQRSDSLPCSFRKTLKTNPKKPNKQTNKTMTGEKKNY